MAIRAIWPSHDGFTATLPTKLLRFGLPHSQSFVHGEARCWKVERGSWEWFGISLSRRDKSSHAGCAVNENHMTLSARVATWHGLAAYSYLAFTPLDSVCAVQQLIYIPETARVLTKLSRLLPAANLKRCWGPDWDEKPPARAAGPIQFISFPAHTNFVW